ncbi:phosphoenolpyruvate-protein phosphotransferase PtsP [Gammaproteobacteria bacterium]
MLDILHRIVSEVNSAPDLGGALAVIVRRVKQAIGADVCSVYLTDFDKREHVLQATDGLNPEAVGKVRLPYHRGLIGLVCERAEPVNLANAQEHPCYLRVVETGEERFLGFLGVPIIQNRKVLGVLVVREIEERIFDDNEVAFLFTLAAQLAGAIVHAQASGELATLFDKGTRAIRYFQGRSSASGVALGVGVVVYPPADLEAVPDRTVTDVAAEEGAFRRAVAAVLEELERLRVRVASSLSEEDRALFDAWRLMLSGDTLVSNTNRRIQEGNWAPGALRETIREHTRIFEAMEDPYFRERVTDIRDLGLRILRHLQQGHKAKPPEYPSRAILVGEEISAVQLAEVPRERLAGVVSVSGSSSSHIAILARALGVPAVMGVTDLPVNRMNGRDLIVDGFRDRIHVSPTPAVRAEYRRMEHHEQVLGRELEALKGLPSETPDGYTLPLFVNTGLLSELDLPLNREAAGIGLYRTEIPFMIRNRFPSETEQMDNYRQVLAAFAPRWVTIRTLDVGGDKPLPYFPVEETNAFLGWRGIRLTLDHPEIFLTQIRALLRAAIGTNNLRILLPMISQVSEVDDTQLLIQRAHDELREEGYQVTLPPVGVMIEVPAAVYQIDALARRVAFLSIGTNDLTQYLLAVDRNNAHVAGLFDDLHPAVLRAIMQVVQGAKSLNREVGICGELASSPLGALLLLGMGVDSLSMSTGSLLKIKRVIRSFNRSRARDLLQASLRCETAEAVRRLLSNALEDMGLGSLVGYSQ